MTNEVMGQVNFELHDAHYPTEVADSILDGYEMTTLPDPANSG